MSEQINAVIDNLADKLGVAVSEVYQVMINQAGAEIVKSIFSIVLCFAVLALCRLYAKKVFIEKDEDGNTGIELADPDIFNIILWLSLGVFVLAAIMLICIIDNANTIIQCAMNPEYWALKRVFELVK